MKLIQSYDFVGLQETHSTDGAVKAMSMPTGIRPFWSHGSTRKAGIGLLVKEQFLLSFNAVTDDSWEEVEPGRAAVLRLRGPQGALDIFVLYHHTGASTQAKSSRSSTRAFLSTAIQPQAEVLSILMGDFNYVAHHRDRFNKANNNGVESSDGTEESSFRRVLGEPFDLCELQQEEYTHDSALGRSRLDRVYSNHHLSDQLDRRIGCVALNWVPWLSAHRPVGFFRQTRSKDKAANAHVPMAPMKDRQWPRRVALRYGELRSEDGPQDQPMRRLVLIKQAIREVSRAMDSEKSRQRAESTDDKLGWTMRFIRASEELRMTTLRKCVEAYPHLATLTDAENPNNRLGAGLQNVRRYAVEMARTSVVEDMRRLYADSQQLDELQRTMRRENIQTRLNRRVPGTTTSLKAMRTPDGRVTVDPGEMAAVLQDHWGTTFSARSIHEDKLQAWLSEVFPDGGQGRTVTGLPEPTSARWHVEREDVEKAIKASSDTMPGPDGIPYAAWRALGPLGIDILFDAAEVLATPDGPQRMQDAADGENHEFNLGILCCLPKKVTGTDATAGDFYSAENTRPLSIVNTDNRLITNAYRLRWEPLFNDLGVGVSSWQCDRCCPM